MFLLMLPSRGAEDTLPFSEEETALALAGDFRPTPGELRALMSLLPAVPIFAAWLEVVGRAAEPAELGSRVPTNCTYFWRQQRVSTFAGVQAVETFTNCDLQAPL